MQQEMLKTSRPQRHIVAQKAGLHCSLRELFKSGLVAPLTTKKEGQTRVCNKTVAQVVERSPTNRKGSGLEDPQLIQSTVSLGKILNPKLPPMCVISVWMCVDVCRCAI